MTLDEIRDILQRNRPELERRGVESVAVFGSTARGDAGPTSDVDLLVRLAFLPTLFQLGGLQVFFQDLLGRTVDLAVEEMLRPEVREQVLREAVRAA